MKDERFNELMEKYVNSTKRGEDADLRKLRNRGEDKARRQIPKSVWVACALVLVVVISLSVALPIVFNKEEAPQTFYCDVSNLEKKELKEFTELKDKYNFSCLLPSIEFIESTVYVMNNKEDNNDIGFFIDISVFDENFDNITFNVLKKQYIMVQLQYFDKFTDSVKWRDTTVRYSINDENNDSYYSYAMTFTIGNYNYFIDFDSFSEMSVTEALDMIYSEDVKKYI